jgi:hypothetical protein
VLQVCATAFPYEFCSFSHCPSLHDFLSVPLQSFLCLFACLPFMCQSTFISSSSQPGFTLFCSFTLPLSIHITSLISSIISCFLHLPSFCRFILLYFIFLCSLMPSIFSPSYYQFGRTCHLQLWGRTETACSNLSSL